MSATIPTSDMDNFVALSVILTGFAESVIAPFFDTYNLKDQVYAAAKADDADALSALLAQYAALAAQSAPPETVIAAVMQPKETPTARMARSIILAWYSGAWYATADLYSTSSPPTPRVLSTDAYTQGLMWKAGQAHAMGSADSAFGYWNTQPPALAQFTGTAST
ncbi:hypothetical protein TSH100_01725 [Azospirillum sp. TSH100]|uniref:sorbitol dehydrogenase n=1 Tax=Azospirillum sp. TSH100 TaxID=652764 RepID=UPI000D614B5F|nr:sorbitol dehydrogenase [Azospirillum sp. TSH100]PWC90778.1 hypothetical protein TSH100_01725 [Azospirillum sp. TSH100]QCG90875.1 sorbitol dehydrogenase [Azospirillum sp. TSH100]